MKYEIKNISGIKCALIDLPDSNSVTMQIFVKAGSIYETQENNGISHFLEHMFFKGGRKYKTASDVNMAIDSFGGECNAYTSKYTASYYVKSAPMYIDRAMDILGDMMCHPSLPVDEMEIEKGVIIQEMKMYQDNPTQYMMLNRSKYFVGDNAYGRPIIGTQENVLGFGQQDLIDRRHKLYTKDNMLLVISGKYNHDTIEDLISKNFGDIYEHPADISHSPYMRTPPTSQIGSCHKNTEQNHLMIAINTGITTTHSDRYIYALLATILGGHTSSRLYQEIREKRGLCYYINAGHSVDSDKGVLYIRAGMDKNKWQEGLDAIYAVIDDLHHHGVSQQDYDIALGHKTGSLQMGIEGSDQYSEWIGPDLLLHNIVESIDDIIKYYKSVTLSQINDRLSILDKNNIYLYYVE